MSLKKSYFVTISTTVSQFYAFLPNSSLINEFILLNRRSYNKKGRDNIFSAKKTIFGKEIVLGTPQTTYRKTSARFIIAIFFVLMLRFD